MQETGTAELHYGMPKMKAVPKLSNCCLSTGLRNDSILDSRYLMLVKVKKSRMTWHQSPHIGLMVRFELFYGHSVPQVTSHNDTRAFATYCLRPVKSGSIRRFSAII
jgi:hypothetical protein